MHGAQQHLKQALILSPHSQRTSPLLYSCTVSRSSACVSGSNWRPCTAQWGGAGVKWVGGDRLVWE